MTNDEKLMQQALDALETLARYENPQTKIQVRKKDGSSIVTVYPHKVASDAAATLRARLAQPEPEPVACKHKRYSVDVQEQTGTCYDCGAEGRMQFVVDDTRPQPAAWVGLTDDEIYEMYSEPCTDAEMVEFARAIESKLREKNT